MRFRLFQYSLPADEELADLNAFLAGQRVSAVSHHVAPHAGGAVLVFVVETVSARQQKQEPSAPRVDYREILNEEEFAAFSALRQERKRIAEAEGIPVYAVFSNAQLADMVQNRRTTAASISEINGVGQARVEKYAPYFVPILASLLEGNRE